MSILRFPERPMRDLLIFLAAFLFAVQAVAIEIPLQKQGGVYSLPVRINGVITLNFILDSGASEVTIPADVALTLLRAGTISEKDFLPGQKYRLADGSILKGARFKIRELEVGGFRISNIPAVVAPATGSLLLGQSFLSRTPHWAIDNERQLLVISDSRRAETRTMSDVQRDLVRAAKTAVRVYKQNGMAGLIGETNECYDKGKENGFYCVYLDLASRHIDQIMVAGAAHSGMTFPKTEFFDDELFGSRIVPVFRKANMNMDKSNQYLRTLTPAINKLVEDNF